ncbi:hypothetical protein [Chamaesiphon sp. VAR_48_metabat_403]|uniref:hypothetical protein n=1 Tax=Chamaesiphon sp. VAR_48_metabat_403 TaxID=2964700 RepID=UPI00286D8A0A|nr:hypothetical protein [Chamaesiphon sp. VAR_48_metabat_403]
MSNRKPDKRRLQPGELQVIMGADFAADLLVVLRFGLELESVREDSRLYTRVLNFADTIQNDLFDTHPDLFATLKQLSDSIQPSTSEEFN